jgi:hypothetical protein
MVYHIFLEFDSVEPNSKKHRNIEKVRISANAWFGSVRFGSVEDARKIPGLIKFFLKTSKIYRF